MAARWQKIAAEQDSIVEEAALHEVYTFYFDDLLPCKRL